MPATTAIYFAAFLTITTISSVTSFVPCLPLSCLNGICGTDDTCPYKSTLDNCNRLVCKKGPDEPCGGPFNIRGICGRGLICSCGICVGCSTDTMKCSTRDSFCNYKK